MVASFQNTAIEQIPPLPASFTTDPLQVVHLMSGYLRNLSAWTRHVADTLNILQPGNGPVPVSTGGTGLASLTTNVVYKGAGTAPLAPSAITENGTGTIISYNAGVPPVGPQVPSLQVIDTNVSVNAVELDASQAGNQLRGFRCENTIASPTGTAASSSMLRIMADAFESGGGGGRANNIASLNFITKNATSTTDHSSAIVVTVTPGASTTLGTVAQFNAAADGGTQLIGTTGADNAPAGFDGEYVESIVLVGSEVSITAVSNVVQLTNLGAGDWDVWGELWVDTLTGAATISGRTTAVITTTSATVATTPTSSTARHSINYVPLVSSASAMVLPVGPVRLNFSSATTVYLVGVAPVSGGTTNGYGKICARRVR